MPEFFITLLEENQRHDLAERWLELLSIEAVLDEAAEEVGGEDVATCASGSVYPSRSERWRR